MKDKPQILVIEDDAANRKALARTLTREGYSVESFDAAGEALAYLQTHPEVFLVLTDLRLPEIDGFGVLERARAIDSQVRVLMITGHASVESAVDAMKKGADDYLTKPINVDELRERVAGLMSTWKLSRRVDELETRLGEKFGKLIGQSRAMEALFRQMDLVAAARSNVLINGESGTGKELVANALHDHSPRQDKRFLPINCAAIPAEILESELFGHEKGAFTGASARKVGKFELADGGTLFLDEIGELPLDMQVKLLRVLEQREFMRVGGTETIHVDIRLVAATNRDLEAAVAEGTFRNDLYYRLKVVTLTIPPLRERREDVPLLIRHFLDRFAEENGREGLRIGPHAMRALCEGRWEGNVRELKNVIESLVVLTPQDEIGLEDLPPELRPSETWPVPTPGPQPTAAAVDGGDEALPTMEELERQAILRALERTGGNRTQAAEILGIGLRTLQRKLKDYRLAGKSDGN